MVCCNNQCAQKKKITPPSPPPLHHHHKFLFSLTEKVLGIKIRTFGFKGHFKKRSVIIMNHVSHFDWLFFWSVVDRYGDFSIWKVITKEKPLRQLPILGKCRYFCTNFSLSHTWEDLITISCCLDCATSIILCPCTPSCLDYF